MLWLSANVGGVGWGVSARVDMCFLFIQMMMLDAPMIDLD